MRILHVHSGNLFGGVERMLMAFARARPAGDTLQSSFALCFDGRVARLLRDAGGEVLLLGDVRTRRPDMVWRARRALGGVLKAHRWDAAMVHSAWSQAIFGAPITSARIPLVRWLHSPGTGPLWMERWAWRSTPALLVCNSRYTAAAARAPGPPPARVVHYPPAMPLLVRDAAWRRRRRSALGVQGATPVVVVAARLEAGKGHTRLIDALAQLQSLPWDAWIIGGAQSPDEERFLRDLKARASRAGIGQRTQFLGQRSDISDLLQAADIYCQPNESPDSFGLSFLEALGAGLPVITSDFGGAPEIVTSACGILTPPGSDDAVKSALRRLLESEDCRRDLGRAGAARAAEFCDVDGSMRALASKLQSVAGA